MFIVVYIVHWKTVRIDKRPNNFIETKTSVVAQYIENGWVCALFEKVRSSVPALKPQIFINIQQLLFPESRFSERKFRYDNRRCAGWTWQFFFASGVSARLP